MLKPGGRNYGIKEVGRLVDDQDLSENIFTLSNGQVAPASVPEYYLRTTQVQPAGTLALLFSDKT